MRGWCSSGRYQEAVAKGKTIIARGPVKAGLASGYLTSHSSRGGPALRTDHHWRKADVDAEAAQLVAAFPAGRNERALLRAALSFPATT